MQGLQCYRQQKTTAANRGCAFKVGIHTAACEGSLRLLKKSDAVTGSSKACNMATTMSRCQANSCLLHAATKLNKFDRDS